MEMIFKLPVAITCKSSPFFFDLEAAMNMQAGRGALIRLKAFRLKTEGKAESSFFFY